MTPQLETVLQISAIGTALLFTALAGLIGLMYLLTTQRLYRPDPGPTPVAADAGPPVADPIDAPDEIEDERYRQRRAIALAVAVACAQIERGPLLLAAPASDWRRLHHGQRLGQPRSRARRRQ